MQTPWRCRSNERRSALIYPTENIALENLSILTSRRLRVLTMEHVTKWWTQKQWDLCKSNTRLIQGVYRNVRRSRDTYLLYGPGHTLKIQKKALLAVLWDFRPQLSYYFGPPLVQNPFNYSDSRMWIFLIYGNRDLSYRFQHSPFVISPEDTVTQAEWHKG